MYVEYYNVIDLFTSFFPLCVCVAPFSVSFFFCKIVKLIIYYGTFLLVPSKFANKTNKIQKKIQ